jgi:hypothetical protein
VPERGYVKSGKFGEFPPIKPSVRTLLGRSGYEAVESGARGLKRENLKQSRILGTPKTSVRCNGRAETNHGEIATDDEEPAAAARFLLPQIKAGRAARINGARHFFENTVRGAARDVQSSGIPSKRNRRDGCNALHVARTIAPGCMTKGLRELSAACSI